MTTENKIKFVDLDRIHKPIKSEIVSEINKVIDKGNFILGDDVEKFENKFSEFNNAAYGIGVDSGTSALELALRVFDIGYGDEVIVPANTYIATAYAVTITGAKPVFVDCGEDFLININKIKEAITKKTKAIIPVHLTGQVCDMDEIQKIATEFNLKIVEDSCQAHGAEYKDRKVGTPGGLSCFSFYPGKNLGGMGDGGIIIANDKELADNLKMLRNYGQSQKYHHDSIGYNRRLDTMQAAILNVKLKHLEVWNEQRKEIAKKYRELLKNISGVILPVEHSDRMHVYHLFMVRVSAAIREKLGIFLKNSNIDTGIHYPIPVHLQKSYSDLGYKTGNFPLSEKYANEILSLPLFPGMEENEVRTVCNKLKDYFLNGSRL